MRAKYLPKHLTLILPYTLFNSYESHRQNTIFSPEHPKQHLNDSRRKYIHS